MKKGLKRFTAMLLAFVMVFTMMPTAALMAKVNDTLVSSLATVYDGDEERARAELEALYEAGIIDENGNFVTLDVREDGAKVELNEVAQRIVDGENVGKLTVNGNSATPEQLVQIQQVKSMLEVVKLMDQNVQVTDEHVENLQKLLEGIADGSLNLNSALQTGVMRLNSPMLRGPVPSSSLDQDGYPTTKTGTGNVDATEGVYTAPYISESTYEASHSFTLLDSSNTGWYTDSTTDGSGVDGVITLEVQPNGSNVTVDTDGNVTAKANTTITVKASLNKAQPLPVSFSWSAGGMAFTGDTSGTVTWDANNGEDKTFQVSLADKATQGYWRGSRAFVISVYNIQNAVLSDGSSVWNKTVAVPAEDGDAAQVRESYVWIERDEKYYKKGESQSGTAYKNVWTVLDDGENGQKFKSDEVKITYNFHMKGVYSPTYPARARFKLTKGGSSGILQDGNGIEFSGNAGDHERSVIMTVPEGDGDDYINLTFDVKKDASMSSSSWGAARNECYLNWIKVAERMAPVTATIESVSVPEGTYYSGQIVPVTINLSNYAKPTEDTRLVVNGVACPLLDTPDGLESKVLTFAYTVKDIDTASISVNSLSGGLKNYSDADMSIDGNFPEKSFGTDDNVTLVSDVKCGTIDWEGVKYGIDDGAPGSQIVTILIPFKTDLETGSKNWVANDAVELNADAVSLKLPDFGETAAGAYLKSAYFSLDGGATRYPVYVIGDSADALAVRFATSRNATSYLRKDTADLFFDTEIGTEKNYLGDWDNKKTDGKGFVYFDATADEAPLKPGAGISFFVKGGVFFDKTETTDRPNYDAANIVKDDESNPLGFYKEGVDYVIIQDTENYNKQYDVELVANEALFKAATKGVRAEGKDTLTLKYQCSSRDAFTFTAPKFFTWESDRPDIASIEMDSTTGAGQITLTGNGGVVTFTLTVGNASEDKAYSLSFPITVLEGKNPFLNIPELSKVGTTLTDTDTDVLFASNITARNAAVEKETTFTAKLYHVDEINEEPAGNPVKTYEFPSTVANTVTHITVDGKDLGTPGIYAVVISTRYEGGNVGNMPTVSQDFSATAWLEVKLAPMQVKLDKLDSYSAEYGGQPSAFGYRLTPAEQAATAEVQYTIQKSGEELGERTTVTGGQIPFNPDAPTGLKDTYTITVYAKNPTQEGWSVDSMLFNVYNNNVLELIVKDVVAGEIGGTTGGTGDSVNNTTVAMDNHGKLSESYQITSDTGAETDYKLTFDDFNTLRTDMSLQKLISANYGTGTWGLLSDKLQWSSSDSSLVSIDYKQGGLYSDIRNYSYVSYGPATDFLLVGKDDTDAEGVTITATHAATGMTASVNVTAATLTDQLYVFQFNPQVETDVTYKNRAGETRVLKSNDKGELAVYEPEGIEGSVMAMSKKDGQTYVGTLFENELVSGERDIASLQMYSCNNLRLRSISNATLNFKKPDGSNYSGSVTLRAGVYKNGVYCPDAKIYLPGDSVGTNGRNDISATVTDGKLSIGFDPTQFKVDPNDGEETGAYPGDAVAYVFEYRFADYQPGYVILRASTTIEGEQKPTDSVVNLNKTVGASDTPQIALQTIRQYYDGKPLSYTRDVTEYTENIGISMRFSKVELTTDYVLPGETMDTDESGYTTYTGDSITDFALYTASGQKLTGQPASRKTKADQIIDLSEMEGSTLYVFPFSSVPIGRSVYM